MLKKYNLFFFICAILIAGSLMAIEEPKFKVVQTFDNIEIREYRSYIVAEMIVSSDFEDAGNEAFSALVGYIGGDNVRRESIEMTAPVNQEKLGEEGQKIEMTAPVGQETVEPGRYRVSLCHARKFYPFFSS